MNQRARGDAGDDPAIVERRRHLNSGQRVMAVAMMSPRQALHSRDVAGRLSRSRLPGPLRAMPCRAASLAISRGQVRHRGVQRIIVLDRRHDDRLTASLRVLRISQRGLRRA